jgi:Na+/melibiose symporter-like transporter
LIDEVPSPRPPRFDVAGFLLLGFGLACSQLAIEDLGRDMIPPAAEAGFFLLAIFGLYAYGRHARRTRDPVIDLDLFRVRSFAVAVLPGNLSRVAIGAVPFLLPLFFQLGFGLDPFHSGMLIFVASAADIAMLFGTRHILKGIGMRPVLIANALLIAALLAGFALFDAGSPRWLLVAYLFIFGLARSLQFSSLSALAYADLSHERMSQGSSITTVAMRLGMSAGVGIAATLLQRVAGSGSRIAAADFRPVFVVVALLALAAIPAFRLLRPGDGISVTGHRPRGREAESSAE